MPVADLWAKPEPGAERVSQVLLGTPLSLLSESGDYRYVEGPDSYRGWIAAADVAPGPPPAGEPYVVHDLVAPLFADPEAADPCSEAYYGTLLAAGESRGERRCVALPDGPEWVPAASLRPALPEGSPLDAAGILADARRWLGVPYLWGGGSPIGVDCSGFVQILFRVHGRSLLRDANLQVSQGTPVEVDALQPGDLVFFGRSDRGLPTHVGIALDAVEYIHAHSHDGHRVEISLLAPALDTVWGARRIG